MKVFHRKLKDQEYMNIQNEAKIASDMHCKHSKEVNQSGKIFIPPYLYLHIYSIFEKIFQQKFSFFFQFVAKVSKVLYSRRVRSRAF